MKKTQLLLILIGLVSVVILYSFPKSIVKSNVRPTEEANKGSAEHNEAEELKSSHQMKVPKEELIRMERLKKNYKQASNKEKKITFADSLIEAYRRAYQFDSSALLNEQVLDLRDDKVKFVGAGDLFIEAVNFASEEEKSKYNTKAQTYYQQALKQDAKNLEAKAKLAMTYVGSETPMQAILLLREVLTADAKNQLAIYNLGLLSIQSGQYDKAVGRFEELIKINPEHATAYFYLGVSRSNLGEKEKAVKAFEKAKELDTDPEFRATVDSYLNELKGSTQKK